MSIVFLIIIGAAAGFLATRLMNIEADIPTTVVIGIAGALVGGLLVQFILAMLGMVGGLIGAVLGAMALIWAWQKFIKR